jgi:hypothetical protein
MCGGGVSGLFAGSLNSCREIRVLFDRTKQKFCVDSYYTGEKKRHRKEGGCNAAIYHRFSDAAAPSGHTCANEK